uniref:Variant surface glycoprotein 1125.2593 n=1 Tax=Trypanosoma brucei TaxID=5691 RepID=A0A1J0R8C6_9TRYP|nr:variant surface glycoprotein 1125.2593 [Trypanosoma brucei]
MIKLQLQVYAAGYPTSEYADAAEVLAAQAEKPRAAALSGAEYAIDTGLRATAITADLAAALATPIMTIASAGGRSNYCLNSKGGNKDTGSGKPEIAAAGCKELELDTLVTTDGMASAAIDADGFPGHPAVTGTQARGQASQCGMFTTTEGVTTNPGINIGSGDTFKMGYGTITVAADDQPNAPNLAKLKTGNSYGQLNIFKRAHKVGLELRQIANPKESKKSKDLLKELAEQPSIIILIQEHLAAANPGKKASQLISEATTAKTNYFGDNNNKLEAMWSAFEEIDVKGSKDDTNQQQQIKALGDVDTLERVLAYYTAVNERAFLALEKENKKIKEATGSTGKAGDNCKKHNSSVECAGKRVVILMAENRRSKIFFQKMINETRKMGMMGKQGQFLLAQERNKKIEKMDAHERIESAKIPVFL